MSLAETQEEGIKVALRGQDGAAIMRVGGESYHIRGLGLELILDLVRGK